MDLDLKVAMPKLHNFFEVVVKENGEVIRREYAENIVKDAFYRDIIFQLYSTSYQLYIAYGDGFGVPDALTTNMFGYKGQSVTTNPQIKITPERLTITTKIIIPESAYIGGYIREVALRLSSDRAFVTHAVLVDSEGNGIAIGPKTNTQIIEINYTLYVERGANIIAFPNIFSDVFYINNNSLYIKGVVKNIQNKFTGPLVLSKLGLEANTRLLTDSRSIEAANYNNDMIFNVIPALPFDMTAIVKLESNFLETIFFPNHDIFPPYTFSKRIIGIGDGLNTKFGLSSGYFMDESLQVWVDNTPQIRDIDYVIAQGYRQPYSVNPSFLEVVWYFSNNVKEILSSAIPLTREMLDVYNENKAVNHIILDLKTIEDHIIVCTTSNNVRKPAYSISNDLTTWSNVQEGSLVGVNGYIVPDIPYRYIWISIDYAYQSFRYVTPTKDYNIKFTTPPPAGKNVEATWATDIPPKNKNIFYNVSTAITFDW